MLNWSQCYKAILPYLVSIETPEGSGSGFFFAYNGNRSLAAFATAAHVVQHADTWKLPIKVRHHVKGKEGFFTDSQRVILVDQEHDSATILIQADYFELPDEHLPMMEHDKYQPIGSEVGWVGYPGLAEPHLCFFSGRVSAFVNKNDSYLIDGVAINGVSGGPVFKQPAAGLPVLLGTVSAYLPNRLRGDSLPGLVSAQDVTSFHEVINTMKTLEEGRRQKEEAEKAIPPVESPPSDQESTPATNILPET